MKRHDMLKNNNTVMHRYRSRLRIPDFILEKNIPCFFGKLRFWGIKQKHVLFFLVLTVFLLPAVKINASNIEQKNAAQENHNQENTNQKNDNQKNINQKNTNQKNINQKNNNQESVEQTRSLSGLSVSFSYGFDKSCKYGRLMNVIADITNDGDDFNGTIGILYRSEDEGNGTLYEAPCVLGKGETKKIELSPPVVFGNRPILIIKDEQEKVVFQKTFQVSVTTTATIPFVGVLTEDASSLDSIHSSHSEKIFLLDRDTLPSTADGLDSLDILLISNYPTDQLDAGQTKAILEWTKNGGMLVFFIGTNASRTLSAFQDDIFDIASNGSFSLLSNSMQLSQLSDSTAVLEKNGSDSIAVLEKGNSDSIAVLKKDGSDSTAVLEKDNSDSIAVSEKDGSDLIVKNAYGSGTVLTAAFALGEDIIFNDSEQDPLQILEDNLSQTAKKRLQETSSYDNVFSYLMSYALNSAEQRAYPHLRLYVLILLLYAVITGPVLYVILKKVDKRQLLWVLMPASCLVCTLMIYFAGSSSRITEPYIRYVSLQKIDPAKETDGAACEIFFHITAPYNKKYSVTLPGISNLGILDHNNYTYYYEDESSLATASDSGTGRTISYKTALYKDENDTATLILNDYAAFESAAFFGSFTETDDLCGSIENDVRVNKDFSLSGTLTNRLGYGLKQAVYISNGQAYILGDLADGESVSLKDCASAVLNSVDCLNTSADPSGKSLISILSGGDGWDSSTQTGKRQLYFAYQYYLTCEASLLLEDGHILAAADREAVSVFDESGLSSDGLQLVDIRSSPAASPLGRVECLDQSISSIAGGTASYPSERYVYGDSMIVNFKINHPEEITALIYSEYANLEFSQMADDSSGSVSSGTLFAYNIITGKYDPLFITGEAGICKNLSDYVTSDGQLQLYYQPLSPEEYESGVFPMLYLLRRTP